MSPKKKKKTVKKKTKKKVAKKKATKKTVRKKTKKKTSQKSKALELEVVSDQPSKQVVSTQPLPSGDPLQRYLKEIRQYALLEPEEELELVHEMIHQGNVNAAKRLVQANLRLVVKIAMEYSNFYTNLLDLIQEGNIGLMKAVSKYDPTKGARLGYYSTWWIRSYILKYILDNFRLVKIGTTQAQKKLFYHLSREMEKLQAQGIQFGPKLLAEKLDVKESEVKEMQQRLSGSGAEMSLNVPANRDDSGNPVFFQDLLEDKDSTAIDETLAHEQMIQILKDKIPEFEKSLNEKELNVLNNRILSDQPMTLQEVANEYGLTRERVRQIEAKIILKLKDYLQELN